MPGIEPKSPCWIKSTLTLAPQKRLSHILANYITDPINFQFPKRIWSDPTQFSSRSYPAVSLLPFHSILISSEILTRSLEAPFQSIFRIFFLTLCRSLLIVSIIFPLSSRLPDSFNISFHWSNLIVVFYS